MQACSFILKSANDDRKYKLFLDLQLKTVYLSGESSTQFSGEEEYESLKQDFLETYNKIYAADFAPKGDKFTVGDYLRVCLTMAASAWLPGDESPHEYIRNVKDAYLVAGCFIIDYFLMRYPEQTKIDTIKGKHSNINGE